MKINVMAAGGQLGQEVLQALLDQNVLPEDIIASVRTPAKMQDWAAKGIQVRKADYDVFETMIAAFQDTEILLLIPSIVPVEPRVQQHGSAVNAARAAGVKRILFSSLTTAIPESRFFVSPFLLYAESKIRVNPMDWTLLRNTMYLDPVADWMPELVEMGRLPYPVKSGKVAYTSRNMIAQATAMACIQSGHSHKIYELTGNQALSMEEMAELIAKVTGTPIRFDSITDQEYVDICRTGHEEVPEYLIEILTSIYWAVDNGEFARATDHIERLTGSAPESPQTYLSRRWTELVQEC